MNKHLLVLITVISVAIGLISCHPILPEQPRSQPIDKAIYINHILSTGQSLSIGANGSPALTTTQPYHNVMLDGLSFKPLIENNVETIGSAMANHITASVTTTDYQIAVTRNGVGATKYEGLKRYTIPYSYGLAQVLLVKSATEEAGKKYRTMGITTIHGESDHLAHNEKYYENYLVEWQRDYEDDINYITGQNAVIPLFTDQMSSHTGYNSSTSEIPIAQLSASEHNPGIIYLIGPKYFLNYSDVAHLTNTSYRWLGEYYGKVIKQVVVDNLTWFPLLPINIIRINNTIYTQFHVPVPPLVLDINNVMAKQYYGFEYYDDKSSASINNVEIIYPDTVKITLNTVPVGNNQRLRYAYTGIPGSEPGAQSEGSARGNLRDSDSTSSLYGYHLYNWCVQFDKAIITQ